MIESSKLDYEAQISLKRLLPRLEVRFATHIDDAEWQGYLQRLQHHFPRLFKLLYHLYGQRYDFFYHLENILTTAAQMWLDRPGELKGLDAARAADPHWFQSNRMLGAMCYVDLFAGNLNGIRERIPYFAELGINYLHLMPLFQPPEGDDDGGYAIRSYRDVDPTLGTMADLAELAAELRHHGISLVLDFVFNHTSDEHDWAKRALSGDVEYQNYYRMFPDRSQPDAYESTIRSVFPDEHPGCFTYRNRIRKWVWTTFHNYQWDLNYENPNVFNAMAGEMLFLANQGVEVLRLDAVAFVWKRLNTSCENLPEAHMLIQAFNALIHIAAPAVLFKSEAIVHPDEVVKYISEDECQLSYNPQLMALLWETLATRDVRLLRSAMHKRFAIPGACAWINYIRCHDDIGWAFSDEDSNALEITPQNHRRFLTNFYTGRFEGSFAKGVPFQEDPVSGDARVSGTTASLCGVEKGLENADELELDMAVRRILLLHGVIMTIGGIPVLYLGDEIGLLNDYNYENEIEKTGDTRWIHRPMFDWQAAELRHDPDSIAGKIFQGLLRLKQIRTQNFAFTGSETEIIDTGNNHVFGYFRLHNDQNVLVLSNFSDKVQTVEAKRLRHLGLSKTLTDIVAGRTIIATRQIEMEPYQFMILIGVR